MLSAIATIFEYRTGARSPKLYCPQIPHISIGFHICRCRVRIFPATVQQKTEASKILCLSPAMHRGVIPAKEQLSRTERSIPLLPDSKIGNVRYNLIQAG